MDKAEIEALKAAHPILEVLRDLGVEVQNNRFRCPRPQNHTHGDRTPSVSIRPDRGTFRCWVCADVRGDVLDLVRLVKGCSFREALVFLGGDPGGRSASAPGGGSPRSYPGGPARPRPGASAAAAPPSRPDTPGTPASTGPTAASGPAAVPALEPDGQTSLFPAPPHARPRPAGDASPDAAPAVLSPAHATVVPGSPFPESLPPPRPPDEGALRLEILSVLLDLAAPVQGPVARYLQKRRIFRRTWDGQGLRMIADYAEVSAALERAFGRAALERAGFFNAAGHLRYYRHRLLFPYFDRAGRPVYLQARAIEEDAKPKELSMAGSIPLPYNARLLDGVPGQIYLCEGVIDTLTLLEQGFPAVGVPGAANFKAAWGPLFRNKNVHVAFDPDAPGENGAARAIDLLLAAGVEARRLAPPKGLDLNDWFRSG